MPEAQPAIPTTEPKKSTLPKPNKVERINLAEDKDLCKEVQDHLEAYFQAHRVKRDSYDEVWNLADEMFACGQNTNTRETERTRLDRQGDSRTKTKSQKGGSTLFFRTVRTLAALFSDMLHSQSDPYMFVPRADGEGDLGDDLSEDLARQHNLLMRYSRDQERFDSLSIDILTQLCKYGNVPIYSMWKQESRSVLDRWPKRDGDGAILFDEDGRPQTEVKRKDVWVANRPETNYVPINMFYADPDIGDIQKQNALFVVSDANITTIRGKGSQGEYVNVKDVDSTHLRENSEQDDLTQKRQDNAGLSGGSDGVNTGLFRQMECHALLPIDESKPKGKRWSMDNEPKRYWVTVVGNQIDNGVCVRIERNPDPDDEYPFEMVSLIPDDTDKLYHISLAQLLRANYGETVTARAQEIDSKTLQNNRPMMAVRGEVHVRQGEDYTLSKDKVFHVDNINSLKQFDVATPIDNERVRVALEQDSNDTAGTGPTVRGIPMGGRTSSSEAVNAQDAATLPHKMMAKYFFDKWLRFHARKGVRQWHLYASDKQILKIVDDDLVVREIRPVDLFGNFDIQIKLVDDYDRDMLSMQNASFVAQQLIPLFGDVIDKREAAKQLFEKFAKMDAAKFILPDDSAEQRLLAKRENALFNSGEYVAPSIDENHTAQLQEHRAFRAALGQVADDPHYANVIQLVEQHIQQTEALEARVGQQAAQPQAEAPTQNETPGEAVGNNLIAGPLGALAQQ